MTGGIAGKLGNIFETKGAILGLLRVISGEALSIRYESNNHVEHGFDWFIQYIDHQENYQSKQCMSSVNWSITALNQEGVLHSAKEWLRATQTNVFASVSDCPAQQLQVLCKETRFSADAVTFRNSLSQKNLRFLDQIKAIWDISLDLTFDYLRRLEIRVIPESVYDDILQLQSGVIFNEPINTLIPFLRNYLESHMGIEITPETI